MVSSRRRPGPIHSVLSLRHPGCHLLKQLALVVMGPGIRRDDALKHFPNPIRLTSRAAPRIFWPALFSLETPDDIASLGICRIRFI